MGIYNFTFAQKTGNFQKLSNFTNSQLLLVSESYICDRYRNCSSTENTGLKIMKPCGVV